MYIIQHINSFIGFTHHHHPNALTSSTISPRCHGGDLLRAHRIVLAAVSPYLRQLLATGDEVLDTVTLDLPDAAKVGSPQKFQIPNGGKVFGTFLDFSQ